MICKGQGGRNQELCLEMAVKLCQKSESFLSTYDTTILSIGTDGIDGNSNYAGAVINSETILKEELPVAREYLANHNSTEFFELKEDCLFQTGPTGTNVMDIVLVIISKQQKNKK